MPRLPRRALLVPLAGLVLTGCIIRNTFGGKPKPGPVSPDSAFALTNVNVLPMDRDTVLRAYTVLVQLGRITAMGPVHAVQLPVGTRLIDASGRYLLPAFADLHVHLDPRDAGSDVNRRLLGLFALNGVGVVRNMLGSPEMLRLADEIRAGRRFGPDVVTAGPLVDGASPDGSAGVRPAGFDAAFVTVAAPEIARAIARRQWSDGYPMLKVGDGLSPDAYGELVDEARRVGLPVTGRVPDAVGLHGAIAARQSSIEHLDGWAEALSAGTPIEDSTGWQVPYRRHAWADTTRIRGLATETAMGGVWNVPTLVRDARRFSTEDEAGRLRAEGLDRFVHPAMLAEWREWDSTFVRPQWLTLQLGGIAPLQRRIVRALYAAGAPVLAGTDTPSPWVLPGFALHDELELLVAAGLRPYEALRAATVDAARFLGLENEWGTVAPDRRASLVLLAGDPRADIRRTRDIAGVVMRGRWLPAAALDSLADAVAWRERERKRD